tara:strand:- start:74 stop:730 length:657 start_codon:yes stop_codon:yes gene_type:complete
LHYSIVIPIYNEQSTLKQLLSELKIFSNDNEIIIINDCSDDNSKQILERCTYIKLINQKIKSGKGAAIIFGLQYAKYNKIIITDGDLELKTSELTSLMKLNKSKNINIIFGSRYKKIIPYLSLWNFGNFFLTYIFNYIHNVQLPDALCGVKAFYRSDLKIDSLNSKGFDIDVEITAHLLKKFNSYEVEYLSYNRRSFGQGKKLKILDGFIILHRIFKS